MVSISGDSQALARLRWKLQTVGDQKIKSEMMGEIKDTTIGLIRQSYQGERSPYGQKWPPGKSPGPLLAKTGALLASIVGKATPAGFTVRARKRYGFYHQNGAALRGQKSKIRGSFATNELTKRGKTKKKRFTVTIKGNLRGRLPARPFMPNHRAFPPGWVPEYQASTSRILRRHFGI